MDAANRDTATETCLNCGTTLAGKFCHVCGQAAGPMHRSLLHIGAEFAEALTHGDSRLRRTLRLLVLEPGRLTRDYLDGRRAADVPPLRIYFVALFVLFLTLGVTHAFRFNPQTGTPPKGWESALKVPGHQVLSAWLMRHVGHAVAQPDEVIRKAAEWAERLSLLMVPVTALTSRVLFVGRRPRIRLYDHTIWALHSLAFAMLLVAAMSLAGKVPMVQAAAGFLLFLLPVHVWRHQRGAFGGRIVATAIRAALLVGAVGSGLGLICLLLALIGLEWG